MKSVSLILLISIIVFAFNPVSSYGQGFQCYFEDDTTSSLNFGAGIVNSENGHTLPASRVIRILVIYGQVLYTPDSLDPNAGDNLEWPLGNLPSWKDDLLDVNPSTNPQGTLSKYFYQASSGNLQVVGDYLVSSINNGLFIFNATSTGYSHIRSQLISATNTQMGGNFITNSGITDRSLFDNWSKTATGEPISKPKC